MKVKQNGMVLLLSCCSLLLQQTTYTKRIAIIAPWWGSVLSTDLRSFNRNNGNDPIFALKHRLESYGHELVEFLNPKQQLYDADELWWFDPMPQHIPLMKERPPKEQLLFIWEPPVVTRLSYSRELHQLFRNVYTWHDGLIAENPSRYRKYYYPRLQKPISDPPPFAEKKLLCMMYNNLKHFGPGELKTERIRAIQFFQAAHPSQFDLYGKYWPKIQFPSLVGAPINKPNTIKHYKFFLCYENTGNADGYITEKIFDCFHARCVPVYLGAPNITSYIPSSCFIDARQFRDEESLTIDYPGMLKHLQSITEFEHQEYLNAAEQYCSSEQAQCYSINKFVQIMLKEAGIPDEKQQEEPNESI